MPPRPTARALGLGRIALVLTIGAWVAYSVTVPLRYLTNVAGLSAREAVEAVTYFVMATLLTVSASCYLLCRQGSLRRSRRHQRVPRAELDADNDGRVRSMTALVPCYREQPQVVRQTLLSVALQEQAGLRVVLLIDDPPEPDTLEQYKLLQAARDLSRELDELLRTPAQRFATALQEAEQRIDQPTTAADLESLADHYEYAAAWLNDLTAGWDRDDHTEDFFCDHIIGALARDLALVGAAVRGALAHRSTLAPRRRVQLLRRLVNTFTVEITSFERKQYLSLSSAANKAMNLNSYMGLMGGSFIDERTSAGRILIPCHPDDPEATLHVPNPEFVLNLDADSVLLPEYCLRLVHLFDQPGNERVGVAQTPYSSFPGAPTRVERLAGATTDLQQVVHQGMAELGAAFWVGANAVLRKTALDDLRQIDLTESPATVRFISDRTVIEDTESTLDLALAGWRVESYPERLAYSATPPDFGSLTIQRQRWANGGLLIAPKLGALWRQGRGSSRRRRVVEFVLRLNYLASIAWASAGLLLLLTYPFSSWLLSWWVVAMAAPYFVVMASDLKQLDYKRTDIVRIYGLNLLLLPVNASGVVRSLVQGATGSKVPFARTPKVRNRSRASATFILLPLCIVVYSTWAAARDIPDERWVNAGFAALNALLTLGAMLAMIGVRHGVADVVAAANNWIRRPERTATSTPRLDPLTDWASVLYHGTTVPQRGASSDDRRRPDPAISPGAAALSTQEAVR